MYRLRWRNKFFTVALLTLCYQTILAQYTVNGNALKLSCNEYRLTDSLNTQSGSVWNNNKIDLTQSFNFNFDIFLGYKDAGADGIAFVLQPISTSVGSSGGGLGYEGVFPAVGVTVDTWQNTNNNDPTYDHIAIQTNGDISHSTSNNLAGPVTAINGIDNIEDGNWHALQIKWDATTKTLSAYIDGNLRVSVVKNFVTDIFSGNPMVFWGFTGSTGGANNLQKFRTALNPSFHFNSIQKKCVGEPIQFFDSTVSFTTIAKFYWNFGDGSPLDSVNLNPIHVYNSGGSFTVNQRVIGADGCETTNIQTLLIGTKPLPGFTINDNCVNNAIQFTDTSNVAYGTINLWNWDLGNTTTSTLKNPAATYATGGDKTITLLVKTVQGCESDLLTKTIHIFTRPVIDFTFADSVCLGTTTNFLGTVVSVTDPVTDWVWNIDGQVIAKTQNTNYTYTSPGNHLAILTASSNSSNGCIGIMQKNIFVVNKPTAYFKFNTICQNTITTFTDSSYTTDGTVINQWGWSLGNLGFSALQNPQRTFIVSGNDTIKLVVYNSKGCISDTLKQPIIIHAKPLANFGYSTPVCNGLPVQFSDSSKVAGADVITQWSWLYNAAEWSTVQNPSKIFATGLPIIQLVTTSNAGCVSNIATKSFVVNANPDVVINFKDACKNAAVDFTAIDNSGTVAQWKWNFGDGTSAITQNAQHVYTANGIYKVKLFATAANGCFADSLNGDIKIYSTDVFAGNDTIAASGQPVQLHATGGLSYSWTPAFSLSDPNIADPVATLTATQTFTVKAFTPEGCESFDDVTIKIYKGPDIYLPNAFTPNGDGLNDIYRAIPVGIKQFNYLNIYNRWGQLIFSTTDYRKGWDGLWQGQKQNNGAFIVIASGIDFSGKAINKKQPVLLIR